MRALNKIRRYFTVTYVSILAAFLQCDEAPCVASDVRINHEVRELSKFYDPHLCGPISLFCVSRHLGKSEDIATISRLCSYTGNGVSVSELRRAAASMGIYSEAKRANLEFLRSCAGPAIIEYPRQHFCAFFGWRDGKAVIQDPPKGVHYVTKTDLKTSWDGVVILFSLKHAEVGWSVQAEAASADSATE